MSSKPSISVFPDPWSAIRHRSHSSVSIPFFPAKLPKIQLWSVPFRFTPAIAVAGHWFHKRRPFAIGVMASGSSVGGAIYPIVLQRLIPKVGFPWAVRVMAFITMGCLAVSCVSIKTRLTPKVRRGWREGLVDLSGFKEPTFCLACFATFMWAAGLPRISYFCAHQSFTY